MSECGEAQGSCDPEPAKRLSGSVPEHRRVARVNRRAVASDGLRIKSHQTVYMLQTTWFNKQAKLNIYSVCF